MSQKLTVLVLLSTVIGIGTGASADANDTLFSELPTPKLVATAPSTSIETVSAPVLEASVSSRIVAPSPAETARTASLEESDQADGVLLPATTHPEDIGGLGFRQSGTTLSQVPAAPPPADSFPEPLPEPEPTPDPVLPTTPAPPTESADPTPETGPTVTVQEFDVLGSSVFETSDFDAVLAPFVGQSLGIVQLRQAADSIT